jgi:hypothetical protein
MLRKILSYGVVAGLIVGIPMFTLTVAWNGPPSGYVFGYLTMLVALSTVFIAIKRHRDVELGGVIRFWPAFGLGLGISLVAGILDVVAWEAALDVSHLDFAGSYAKAVVDHAIAKGVSGDALAKITAEMAVFKQQYARPLYRLPMTFAEIFPVGVLVSLVSAGLLRNSRFLPLRRAAATAPGV